MAGLIRIRRAILSVSDKSDLGAFARALHSHGVDIVSTGGTARRVRDEGIPVRSVDELTGFPEMMDGRVKTLHPKVHGGLLALRENAEHVESMREHGIEAVDLVVVNLYPFEQTVSSADVAEREAIEQIDIGGPSMIRSGSKNFEHVAVVTSPKQYDRLVSEMTKYDACTSRELRSEFAAAAFARTAEYDAAISSYLGRHATTPFPDVLTLRYTKVDALRYGENPHQDASLYRDPASTGPTVVNSVQLHGKALSYNNLNDAAAALEVVKDLRKDNPRLAGAAVIKHTNPCGVASSEGVRSAIVGAMDGDRMAAYGGIMAVNTRLTGEAASELCQKGVFLEVVLAPSFDDEAIEMLRGHSANVRLLEVGDRAGSSGYKLDYKSLPGGMLAQTRDSATSGRLSWEHAAGPLVDESTLEDASIVWSSVKHLRSNAVAIGGAGEGCTRLFGAGSGCVDRVTACRNAIHKAGELARGAIAASDAFFPFPDGPEMLIDAGVSVIVHPGGSKRDAETFALCEDRGVTCLVTGVRHFKH
ncbi:MAG: bifunctional phosphoribosylaminoimidazolecarboxamide formyltransferase/IMP cyclohydrolase [Planctomycetota bacterium]|jgi:phosphoribosylaminoimidazolecarboxamide formyltransferase/IMP cyclohydrolase